MGLGASAGGVIQEGVATIKKKTRKGKAAEKDGPSREEIEEEYEKKKPLEYRLYRDRQNRLGADRACIFHYDW